MYQFYEELFSKNVSISNKIIAHYLKDVSLPKLTKEHSEQCEDKINALGTMICNKTPGNNCLTSEFYEDFWSELKTPLLLYYRKSFLYGELSISQKQGAIKLTEKRQR